MNKANLILIIFSVFLFISCEKPPGEGGNSAIKGKVYAKDYNKSGQLTGEYYAPDENVYIIYGDDNIYSNDMGTHYDGSYLFKDLRKGKYTIFAYSDDTSGTSASGLIPVTLTVEITDKKQIVEATDLVIIK